jgi:riboflavin kinase
MVAIGEDLHLPDLSFVRLCKEQYGINRGVYNTIDLWFYEKGFYNIVKRRELTLNFLQFTRIKTGKINRVTFGNNGLTQLSNDFLFQITTNP